MAASFDSHAFDVFLDDQGFLPIPVPDEDGLDTYTATIQMASGSISTAIRALHSKVTILPAMGGGGLLVTERGPGVKTLVYPTGNGDESTRYAILIGFQEHPFHMRDTDRRADCVWLLGETI